MSRFDACTDSVSLTKMTLSPFACIIDQLGELYARADEILDRCIEEARDRKLAPKKENQ
jgi:hypothetical protein